MVVRTLSWSFITKMGLYHKSEESSLYCSVSCLLPDRVRKRAISHRQFLPENHVYAACPALPESSRFTEHAECVGCALAYTSRGLQACSSLLRGIPVKGHGWKQVAIAVGFCAYAGQPSLVHGSSSSAACSSPKPPGLVGGRAELRAGGAVLAGCCLAPLSLYLNKARGK